MYIIMIGVFYRKVEGLDVAALHIIIFLQYDSWNDAHYYNNTIGGNIINMWNLKWGKYARCRRSSSVFTSTSVDEHLYTVKPPNSGYLKIDDTSKQRTFPKKPTTNYLI